METKNVQDMYRYYKKKYPDTDVTYPLFKHIFSEFCKKSVTKILEGRTLYLGHRLGLIRIKKVARSFKKPTVNWFETNKLKKKGINRLVYYTDEFWYRWYWNKSMVMLKNKSVYQFAPTKGQNGATKQLVRKLKNDEFAHLNFSE